MRDQYIRRYDEYCMKQTTADIRNDYFGKWIRLPVPHHANYLCSSLVTNGEFLEWLNANDSSLGRTSWRTAVNYTNYDQPLKLQDGQWCVRDGFERHPVVGVRRDIAMLFARDHSARLPYASEMLSLVAYYYERIQMLSRGCVMIANHLGVNDSVTPVTSFEPTEDGYLDLFSNARIWLADTVAKIAHPSYGSAEIGLVHGTAWNKNTHQLPPNLIARRWTATGSMSLGIRLSR